VEGVCQPNLEPTEEKWIDRQIVTRGSSVAGQVFEDSGFNGWNSKLMGWNSIDALSIMLNKNWLNLPCPGLSASSLNIQISYNDFFSFINDNNFLIFDFFSVVSIFLYERRDCYYEIELKIAFIGTSKIYMNI